MVQTKWRSPTGSALLVTVNCKVRFVLHDQRVKNSPLHNHGDQQEELVVHRAKVQLKSSLVIDGTFKVTPTCLRSYSLSTV